MRHLTTGPIKHYFSTLKYRFIYLWSNKKGKTLASKRRPLCRKFKNNIYILILTINVTHRQLLTRNYYYTNDFNWDSLNSYSKKILYRNKNVPKKEYLHYNAARFFNYKFRLAIFDKNILGYVSCIPYRYLSVFVG